MNYTTANTPPASIALVAHLRASGYKLESLRCDPRTVVATPDTLATRLFVIASGQVVILHRCSQRPAALAILGAGAAFGAGHVPTNCAASRCIAVERSVIWTTPAAAVREPSVQLALWHTQMECIAQADERYEAMAYQTLDRRMAGLLLRLAQGRQYVPVTHYALADILGAWRESISGLLREMSGAGLISRGYGQIQLRDVAGLRALADPCGAWPVRQVRMPMAAHGMREA